MIIRACLPSDADAIERLFQEFVAYLKRIGDERVFRFGAAKYLADGFGPAPAFRGLLAETPDGVVGYVLFSNTYDDEYVRSFHILDLYVQEGARSLGVGRTLMQAMQDLARAEGIGRLSWSVHTSNAGARRFYESLGASHVVGTTVMYLDVP